MKNRIMIDLETLGTSAGSVIVSIGAVRFDAHKTLDTFYCLLDIEEAQREWRFHIDASTVLWWLKQSEQARAALTSGNREGVASALIKLANFIRLGSEADEVWGNGSDFDNVLLADYYRKIRMPLPWKYTRNRCYRTIAAPHREQFPIRRTGTHHNALDDALDQANHLLAIEGKQDPLA